MTEEIVIPDDYKTEDGSYDHNKLYSELSQSKESYDNLRADYDRKSLTDDQLKEVYSSRELEIDEELDKDVLDMIKNNRLSKEDANWLVDQLYQKEADTPEWENNEFIQNELAKLEEIAKEEKWTDKDIELLKKFDEQLSEDSQWYDAKAIYTAEGQKELLQFIKSQMPDEVPKERVQQQNVNRLFKRSDSKPATVESKRDTLQKELDKITAEQKALQNNPGPDSQRKYTELEYKAMDVLQQMHNVN